jgi:hypothetical protein
MPREIRIDLAKIVKEDITMNVTVILVNRRRVLIRLWIAKQLVRLAAWIGGYGLKINEQVGVIVEDKYMERVE